MRRIPWETVEPGHCEVDLVHHAGGSTAGEYGHTLQLIDVATGWSERVFALFPRLRERVSQKAGTLSGGEQQMAATGRALMAEPCILLLDEPSMGLATNLVDFIFDIIVDINRQRTTILLVEQNALMALSTANRGDVLQTGQVILHDIATRLRENQLVHEAYLGEE